MAVSYDYIIVGGGTAGCVLANRLSANPDIRVLLVEAGPRDWNPLIRVPMLAGRFYRKPYLNWFYSTEPQAHLGGRRIPWPRGRVLGGTSAINGMIYARGNPSDFDGWAQQGLTGWSYDAVLPYFKKSECHEGGADAFHGGDGPLPVTRPKATNRLYEAFLAAGVEAGYPATPDFNGASQEGFGRYDYNIRGGQRWSAARSFLAPIRRRANLRVLTDARLLKIVHSSGRASGVELLVGGRKTAFRAEGEVVLSCGAVGSPAALMNSGIGDGDKLRRAGIAVSHELKGVGENLQDHLHFMMSRAVDEPDGMFEFRRIDRAVSGVVRALVTGNGPATYFPTLAGAFLRSDSAVASPDIQIHFIMGRMGGTGADLRLPFQSGGNGVNGSICQLHPESRGEIAVTCDDPLAPPAIRPNYLSSPTDRRVMREGFRMMREIYSQPAFAPYRAVTLNPDDTIRTDAEIDAWIAANSTTIFHPVGSCRMGMDAGAVVDERLRVWGIEGLRVVDASVMPTIVSANTNAATAMIAERGADLILNARH